MYMASKTRDQGDLLPGSIKRLKSRFAATNGGDKYGD